MEWRSCSTGPPSKFFRRRLTAISSFRISCLGGSPAYADYLVFGAFQWARAISDLEVLAAGDPIGAWRGRMLDLFDGLARRAPAYGD